MRKLSLLFIGLVSFGAQVAYSQTPEEKRQIIKNYDQNLLSQLEVNLQAEWKAGMAEAYRLADIYGWEKEINLPDGGRAVLVGVIDGKTPKYYQTDNKGAGITTRTDRVQSGGSAGLDLNGENMVGGVWDGGKVRASHILLENRVTQEDNSPSFSDHATHVSGTMIGTGDVVNGNAKGMAPEATLLAYDFVNDEPEMTAAAAQGLLVSNHSYGLKIEYLPTWMLGFYDDSARNLDVIAYNAPYYLPVTSAGNDRQSGKNSKNGYDYLTDKANSKNNIVTAAVFEVLTYNGSHSVVMSPFSSWGPTDDGRIKPDISAKGVNTYSATSTTNTSFGIMSGTSMATPNVSGSLLLLQQHYNNLNGSYMLSSTLRGLALHTADEAGTFPGPDYRFGWGLMNTEKAAAVITNNGTTSLIIEEELAQDEVYTFSVKANGLEDLVASITWTDPAGISPPQGRLDDRTPILVNDLDIRVSQDGGETFYPWKLNPESLYSAASKGDNIVDNIEKIEIEDPAGEYIIRVSHKGTITNDVQAFSLIISGIDRESFAVSTHQGYQSFCEDVADTSIDLNLEFGEDFTDTINFTVENVPAGAEASITPSSLSAEGTAVLSITNLDNAAPGVYELKVIAAGSNETVNVYPVVKVMDSNLQQVVLTAPEDDAIDLPLEVNFNWESAGVDADEYTFQLSTDADFETIVEEISLAETEYTVNNLIAETDYYWRVLASNACSEGDYSDIFHFTTESALGVSENSIDGLVLYPNPVVGKLHIQANQVIDSYEVINVLGQRVMSKSVDSNKVEIETGALHTGSYLIRITSGNDVTIERFIVK